MYKPIHPDKNKNGRNLVRRSLYCRCKIFCRNIAKLLNLQNLSASCSIPPKKYRDSIFYSVIERVNLEWLVVLVVLVGVRGGRVVLEPVPLQLLPEHGKKLCLDVSSTGANVLNFFYGASDARQRAYVQQIISRKVCAQMSVIKKWRTGRPKQGTKQPGIEKTPHIFVSMTLLAFHQGAAFCTICM